MNAELIKALRCCGNFEDREGCDEECPYFYDKDCPKRIMCDAADALEAVEQRIAVVEEERDLERFAAKNYLDKIDELKARIAELEAQMPKLPDRQEFLAKGSFIEEPLSRPKEGEWIELDKITTYCSNCNWASYSMLVQKDAFLLRNNKTKFCPNCGAKMQTVTDCHTLEEGER